MTQINMCITTTVYIKPELDEVQNYFVDLELNIWEPIIYHFIWYKA